MSKMFEVGFVSAVKVILPLVVISFTSNPQSLQSVLLALLAGLMLTTSLPATVTLVAVTVWVYGELVDHPDDESVRSYPMEDR